MNEAAISILGGIVGGVTFLVGLVRSNVERELARREALAGEAERVLNAAKESNLEYNPSRAAKQLLNLGRERSWLSQILRQMRLKAMIAWRILQRRQEDAHELKELAGAYKRLPSGRHPDASYSEFVLIGATLMAGLLVLLFISMLLQDFDTTALHLAIVLLTVFTAGIGTLAVVSRNNLGDSTRYLLTQDGVRIVKEMQDAWMELMAATTKDHSGRPDIDHILEAKKHAVWALGIYDNFPAAQRIREYQLSEEGKLGELMGETIAPLFK